MPTITKSKYRVKYSVHRPKRIQGISLPLPNYKQQDYYSCGYLAALTVSEYLLRGDFDKTKLLMVVRPSKDHGTTQYRVRKGLESVGIKTTYKDDLCPIKLIYYIMLKLPVIISVYPDGWYGDHWTVVQGFSGWRVYLTNHYSLLQEDFRREWIENWGDGSKLGCGLICERM